VGAFAELVAIAEDGAIAPKPANATFEQAAAVPTAAVTALQALRDEGAIRPGETVLINGASGGVGTFAVQIAKALGGEVTGVCRTENLELVRSLGADHVVDYTREDLGRVDGRYDLVIDVAGSRPWSAYRSVLDPHGTFVIVGGPKTSRFFGPLTHVIRVKLASLGSRRKVVFFIASFQQEDFLLLRDLIEAGAVTPQIDRSFDVEGMRHAFAYLGEGHARAKVVVTLWPGGV
jgi:NADPH:quinone reductase-like Zn-dependent oxidoreductase